MGEFKQIQEILSKIGTEIFKIDEEMTEKNETEDGNSISLKSPWHMKWDRQQFLPFFPVAEIGSIMHLLYFSYPQEILAQFVEWGKKVLSPYSPQWSVYFSISLLQIAGKHPVCMPLIIPPTNPLLRCSPKLKLINMGHSLRLQVGTSPHTHSTPYTHVASMEHKLYL